ncbi:MAG: hypothetical protein J6C46_05970 [Clostridia bacterium]|nr:hypothetical protein [Clostridia bacterium]
MNEKTNDEAFGLVKNGTVGSKEERDEARKRLEYYIKEYGWIADGNNIEDKVKEIEDEARNILPMLKVDVPKDERVQQEYYRKYYQTLVSKQRLVKSGKYAPFLKQNIIALYAAIKQFEIDSLEYTAGSLIKDTLNGEKSVIENWKTDRLLSRLRMWEGIPKEEDLLLQPAEELIEIVTKNLVNIKAPEKSEEEQNLLPAISEGYLSPRQVELIERVETYMKEAGAKIGISEIKEVDKVNTAEKDNQNGEKAVLANESFKRESHTHHNEIGERKGKKVAGYEEKDK